MEVLGEGDRASGGEPTQEGVNEWRGGKWGEAQGVYRPGAGSVTEAGTGRGDSVWEPEAVGERGQRRGRGRGGERERRGDSGWGVWPAASLPRKRSAEG